MDGFNPTQLIETASNELIHMNRHIAIQLSQWTSKIAVVSAGRTSVSSSAKILQSSRRRRRKLVHHVNSNLDELSLSRLDAINPEMKKQSCVSLV